jgi:CheY-like chemotaxis protein
VIARVVIIEDNAFNLELARYLLSAAGYPVLAATDGLEGVKLVRSERPDIVVCDLQMPALDGFGVIEQIRADPALRSIVVVAVSALSMPDDQRRALASGFDGYMSKPIEPETFIAQLENYLPEALRAR